MLIEEYINRPLADRMLHLDLSIPCIERGGNSLQFRGLLAHILDTTLPIGSKIQLCHACHNNACSEPKHLYWGTPKENVADRMANGGLTPFEYSVAKHGYEKACELQRRPANKAGKGNLGKQRPTKHG